MTTRTTAPHEYQTLEDCLTLATRLLGSWSQAPASVNLDFKRLLIRLCHLLANHSECREARLVYFLRLQQELTQALNRHPEVLRLRDPNLLPIEGH